MSPVYYCPHTTLKEKQGSTMPRYKPDPFGRSWLLCPCSKLQQQWHCSFLHHMSVDSLNFFFFFFFYSVKCPFQDYFTHRDEPIDRWAKRENPGKTTWHTRKQNLACLTCGQCGARTYTRHSGEMIEWLRALKYSDLTHSATGAAILLMHVQCINLIWTHTSFVRYCHIEEILCQCWNSNICHLTQWKCFNFAV